jgi:hypothetical protein
MVPEVYQVFWAGMAADESPAKSSVSAVGPPMQVQLSSHKVDRHPHPVVRKDQVRQKPTPVKGLLRSGLD